MDDTTDFWVGDQVIAPEVWDACTPGLLELMQPITGAVRRASNEWDITVGDLND